MFAYPGCKVSGGISLVEDGAKREVMEKALADTDGVKKAAAGGMTTFFVVESIEETLEVGEYLLRVTV